MVLLSPIVGCFYFFLLFSFKNKSMAAGIEGASGVGASMFTCKPACLAALMVPGPKQPIFISPWLKSGKFLKRDCIPDGLKNTNIS